MQKKHLSAGFRGKTWLEIICMRWRLLLAKHYLCMSIQVLTHYGLKATNATGCYDRKITKGDLLQWLLQKSPPISFWFSRPFHVSLTSRLLRGQAKYSPWQLPQVRRERRMIWERRSSDGRGRPWSNEGAWRNRKLLQHDHLCTWVLWNLSTRPALHININDCQHFEVLNSRRKGCFNHTL